jgi:translation initiation factor IF-2
MHSVTLNSLFSTGMVVAFSVNTPRSVEGIAAQNNVPIYSSPIIYRIMDEMKARVISLLPVIIERKVTGEATVLQLFDVHLKRNLTKKVAGCRITNGLMEKVKRARVVRNGITLHEGEFQFLCLETWLNFDL